MGVDITKEVEVNVEIEAGDIDVDDLGQLFDDKELEEYLSNTFEPQDVFGAEALLQGFYQALRRESKEDMAEFDHSELIEFLVLNTKSKAATSSTSPEVHEQFLTKALLYVNNVNGSEIFYNTYGRPYEDDGYCAGKVLEMQKFFDSWFLNLDFSNRRRFVNAVLRYMEEGGKS